MTVVAITYSARWTGGGYPTDDPPTVAMMTDGATDRFYGSAGGGAGQYFRVELEASSLVESVSVGSSTTLGGWGGNYLNGAILEWSVDGSAWTEIQTLSGFGHGSLQSIPVNATCRYLRVRRTSDYLAISEFNPSVYVEPEPDTDRPFTYEGVSAATFGGAASFTYSTEGESSYGD